VLADLSLETQVSRSFFIGSVTWMRSVTWMPFVGSYLTI
jgi:hypothetical protein